MKYDVRERLQRQLDIVASEIQWNGVNNLWKKDEYVAGARIVVEFDENTFATVRYEKTVIPVMRKE